MRSILVRTRPPLWLLMLFATASPFSLLLFIPALPSLAHDLDAGLGTVQWLITAFLISVGSMQLLIGPLADRLGRRSIVLVSLVCFAAISLFAVSIENIHLMIVCRVIQAICAAALSVVSRAAVQDVFEGVEAGKAMSMITLALQVPGFTAPAVGGLLAFHLGWRALFGFQAVFATAMFVLAYFLLSETKPAEMRDNSALSRAFGDYGCLIANPQFTMNAAILALCAAASMTFMTILPSALSELFGKSTEEVGFYASANSVASITGALIAAQLVVRLGMVRLMAIGLAAASIHLAGYVSSLAFVPPTVMNLLLALLVVSFCQSIVVSMGFAQVLGADDRLRGTASGFAGAIASITAASFAAVGAMLYSAGLVRPLLVIFSCFLLSMLVLASYTFTNRRRQIVI
jgi:DHA1 family bicyclomycin/chloramphenicol resistance-like MFS transporter